MLFILLTLISPLAIRANSNGTLTWQNHLKYGMVDTSIKWRNVDKNSGGNKSTPCLQVCVCVGDFANCANKQLTQFPSGGDGMAEIRTLDLTGNSLEDIPPNTLEAFTRLQNLILTNNSLSSLPTIANRNIHLRNLQIGSNKISNIGKDTLRPLRHLRNLGLERNNIETIEAGIFTGIKDLSILNLAFNKLLSVSQHTFKGLARLQVLVLEGNHITNVDSEAFRGLESLVILEINKNELTELPSAIHSLPSLQRLTLAQNNIVNIPEKIFKNNINLQQIEFRGNPIDSFHPNAFVDLPNLTKLQITSDLKQVNVFPNLTGTMSIELIDLNRANIQNIPDKLCNELPNLNTLRLRSNKIQELPILSECQHLRQLDLGSNSITELRGSPFQALGQLKDMLLDDNKISHLSSLVFVGLDKLQYLSLEKNNISEIHKETFVPLAQIRDLNLGQNSFSELPHLGLENLVELKTHTNPNLKNFPNASMFPMIRLIRASYAYHCCQFIPSTYDSSVINYNDFTDQLVEQVFFPGEIDPALFGNQSLHSVQWIDKSGNASSNDSPLLSLNEWESIYTRFTEENECVGANCDREPFQPKEGIDCYPKPGPFLPCNDLFDWWTLRCGVWIVFLLALLGNGCVVFVLAFSRGRIDVPKFLVCNLAMADFFMGLYLGFLAVLDASTLGEFRRYAIQWQLSGACQAAGFFGVLSSELSVFTLAVITLERNYAITHAMHLNKRLSLKHATYIMICGWIFSIIMAALPLIGVSDYRKFAVCLPFETDSALDLGYVVFLMFINGVAFFILMGCYLKMYCAIRGSQAWNSNDSRIAKRMALLVFTDFICWFPIAFFAITAAFGANLISLEGAKVFTVFVLPLNSCCNPFLYAILTKQFKKDCVMICKAIEESRVTRGIGRCRHSSNFSNRQTPANTNSLNSGSGSGSHTKNSCNCNVKNHSTKITPFNKLKALLCGFKDPDKSTNQDEWNCQIAEIQQKQQKTKRYASVSSGNFSSSRSDSWKQGHPIPLRLMDHHRRRNSWTVTRKPSQESNLSSSRNDSAATNSTNASSSTNTWMMSRQGSSVSSSTASASDSTGPGLARRGSGYTPLTVRFSTKK